MWFKRTKVSLWWPFSTALPSVVKCQQCSLCLLLGARRGWTLSLKWSKKFSNMLDLALVKGTDRFHLFFLFFLLFLVEIMFTAIHFQSDSKVGETFQYWKYSVSKTFKVCWSKQEVQPHFFFRIEIRKMKNFPFWRQKLILYYTSSCSNCASMQTPKNFFISCLQGNISTSLSK